LADARNSKTSFQAEAVTRELQDLAELEEEHRLVLNETEKELHVPAGPSHAPDFMSFFDATPAPVTAPAPASQPADALRQDANLEQGLVRQTSIRNTWEASKDAPASQVTLGEGELEDDILAFSYLRKSFKKKVSF
jgi:hypothetical protein